MDAYQNHGLDLARTGEQIGGGMSSPCVIGNIGGAAVKEILTVMKIEDREAAGGFAPIGFGKIDVNLTIVGKKVGVELPQDKEARIPIKLVRLFRDIV